MKSFKMILLVLCLSFGKIVSAQTITVSMTGPTTTNYFPTASSIVLTATASVTSGSITQVDFYRSTTFIGTASLSSGVYSFTWSNVPAGNYTVSAKATTNLGATQNSSGFFINVKPMIAQGGNSLNATLVIGTNDSNKLSLRTNSSDKLTILQNGNVGIGTTIPATQLHLTGTLKLDSLRNTVDDGYLLTTDTAGNVKKFPRISYSFGQGLTDDEGNISLGGIFESGLGLEYVNDDFGFNYDGMLAYSTEGQGWLMSSGSSTDSTLTKASMQLNNGSSSNISATSNYYDGGTNYFGNASIDEYGGLDGAGISLSVQDTVAGNGFSGIQIYSNGIDFESPNIQLDYFPNTENNQVLTTDSIGNIVLRNLNQLAGGGLYAFDNGLTASGDEVYLGGSSENDLGLYYSSIDAGTTYGIPTFGEITYQNNLGEWDLQSGYSNDSLYSNSGFQTQPGYLGIFSTSSASLSDVSFSSNANIFLATGFEQPGISLTVNDSSSSDENGIQIYSTGIDLKAPKIQLNYFQNDIDGSSILSTDVDGYLQLVPISNLTSAGSLTFDNGLSQSGSEVYLGGVSINGLDLSFQTEDGITEIGYPAFGALQYNPYGVDWSLAAGFLNDSLQSLGVISLSNTDMQIGNGGGTSASGWIVNQALITTHQSLYDDPGVSITVLDSTNVGNPSNGIQIYNQGMDLNTPKIQFNYFPNSIGEDSVLATDVDGNLKQKAISSFISGGHWVLADSVTYDTLDNIAIGTSNAQGYKLVVNGDALFTKVKVKPFGSWPDYVFDKKFELPKLADIEDYIQKNNHLPDMPSAAEVDKNGIDVGGNQAALLKKVEELTLYMIELNKKVDKLSKENDELKKKLDSNH